jgi:hypothetical protein
MEKENGRIKEKRKMEDDKKKNMYIYLYICRRVKTI